MNNIFKSLNTGKKLFDVTIDNPVFRKLSSFENDTVLKVVGCYVNKKSDFGEQPVFIVYDSKDYFFVNVPVRHIETVNAIISNDDMVNAVNNGDCFIKVEKYYNNKFKKECFDFEFVDSAEYESLHKENNSISSFIATADDIF